MLVAAAVVLVAVWRRRRRQRPRLRRGALLRAWGARVRVLLVAQRSAAGGGGLYLPAHLRNFFFQ